MTNTEAITKLTNIMHDDHYSWHPSILTAFGMAVDALKGAEGDWISRKEAIDAIESHIRTAEEPYYLSRVEEVMNHAFEIAASCVYNLPSAQSEPQDVTDTNVRNNDLISKQAAIDALLKRDANCGLDSAKVIEQLPPTQPIRCGECRHRNDDGMCRIFREYVFNDDYFCCYAVQKEGKNDV